MGSFMVHTYEGYVLYACTKFEADISIRLKFISGPKISKRDPNPRPFWTLNDKFV